MSNTRGSVALMSAATMALMVGISGLAVDTSRNYLVRTRLKSALDAAALVAARQIDQPTREADARAMFWSHFPSGRGHFGATITGPQIAWIGNSQVQVSATASLDTTLFSVISPTAMAVADSSTAERLGAGLELAIVLDQTGSMDDVGSTGVRKIDAAKNAVRTMLDVLYGGSDTRPSFYVSLVPFARTINIGPQNTNWLDTSGLPINPTTGWRADRWSGCVEARQGGHDITEANPAAAPFRPYFYPNSYQQHGRYWGSNPPRGETNRCTSSQAYDADASGAHWCMGDNDWTAPSAHLQQNLFWKSLRSDNAPANAGIPGVSYFGPNMLCALNPIQPLTASRTQVQAALDLINAPGRSGGTTVVTGMQGGWFTLSPQWQGFWPTPAGATTPVPTAYGTRNMRKVLVLLSDGDNNWQGDTSVAPMRNGDELFYNAYGRLSNNRLPITPSTNYNTTASRADAALDTRWSTLCTAVKNAGITVYVIGFEVANSTHRNLLRNCASSTQHYFESPTASQLQSVFGQIASQIATLRLTQ